MTSADKDPVEITANTLDSLQVTLPLPLYDNREEACCILGRLHSLVLALYLAHLNIRGLTGMLCDYAAQGHMLAVLLKH